LYLEHNVRAIMFVHVSIFTNLLFIFSSTLKTTKNEQVHQMLCTQPEKTVIFHCQHYRYPISSLRRKNHCNQIPIRQRAHSWRHWQVWLSKFSVPTAWMMQHWKTFTDRLCWPSCSMPRGLSTWSGFWRHCWSFHPSWCSVVVTWRWGSHSYPTCKRYRWFSVQQDHKKPSCSLYRYLPDPNCHQYNLRPRRHNFSTKIDDRSLIIRQLFYTLRCSFQRLKAIKQSCGGYWSGSSCMGRERVMQNNCIEAL